MTETAPPPADPRRRVSIRPGMTVDVVQKKDQRSGATTRGTVAALLTNSPFHPHGIKVRLTDGTVGRVRTVYSGTE
jgi:uncharacterized repeat protein (TIGR03833 family)